MTQWFAGADGCRGGWVVVLLGHGSASEAFVCASVAEVIALPQAPSVIAIDVPIGLPETAIKGGRVCCNLARARLGARQSSVFSVPARPALAAHEYREACGINVLNSNPPRKLAKQTFNIMDRIREVDALMTPALQARVFECHPELAFTVMNGERPLDLPKKIRNRPYPEGLRLRRALLKEVGISVPRPPKAPLGIRFGEDDLLDACACAFAARRIARGEALRLPPEPATDARGLRMEINA